jgi:hypothetical protein
VNTDSTWLLPAGLAAGFLLLTACASVPRGSDRLAQQAQIFVPPAGKANLYVIRPYNFTGSAGLYTPTLDFNELGTLGLRSYLYGAIDPGEHFLGSTVQGSSPNRLKFTAEAGRNYFFKVSPGLTLAGWGIDPLDETDGRQLVRDYTLSGDSRFELLKEPTPTSR